MKRLLSSGRNTSAHTPICNFGKDRKAPLSFKKFSPTAVKESTPSCTRWLVSAWRVPRCLRQIPISPESLIRTSLTTWANADPDLPQLRSSRQEFKKLASGTGN